MTTRRVFDGNIPEWARYGLYYTDNCDWVGVFCATEQEAEDAERNLGNSYFAIAAINRKGN